MSKRPSFEQACRQYPFRFTMEHIPHWAKRPSVAGWWYAPQYRTDREWYDNTTFDPEGMHCESTNQSWPMGQRLDGRFEYK